MSDRSHVVRLFPAYTCLELLSVAPELMAPVQVEARFDLETPLGGTRDLLPDLTGRGIERFQSNGIT